jgi:hypothetical protein
MQKTAHEEAADMVLLRVPAALGKRFVGKDLRQPPRCHT